MDFFWNNGDLNKLCIIPMFTDNSDNIMTYWSSGIRNTVWHRRVRYVG